MCVAPLYTSPTEGATVNQNQRIIGRRMGIQIKNIALIEK